MTVIPSDSRTIKYSAGGVSCAVGLTWPTKAPDDVLDYTLDFCDWLCDAGDDTISAATAEVAAANAPVGTFEITSTAFTDQQVTIFVSGGNAGAVYDIRLTITTAAGRVLAIDAWLPVLPDGVFFPPWQGPPVATGPSVLTLGTLAALLNIAPTTPTAGVWLNSTDGVNFTVSFSKS